MAERDFTSEFQGIVEHNYPDYELERRTRIIEASKDEMIDILFLKGGHGYTDTRRELEAVYFLSSEEVDEAISLGVQRIADNIRGQYRS